MMSDFDFADYLHCFADDATGCTVSAAQTVHACAREITRLQKEVEYLTAKVAWVAEKWTGTARDVHKLTIERDVLIAWRAAFGTPDGDAT